MLNEKMFFSPNYQVIFKTLFSKQTVQKMDPPYICRTDYHVLQIHVPGLSEEGARSRKHKQDSAKDNRKHANGR